MSSHAWRKLYRMIVRVDKTLPRPRRRPEYPDVLIVAMYLWAVAHDRPQSWACDRRHYHRTWLPTRLPSQSRFNRRIRSPRCQALLQGVLQASTPQEAGDALRFLDGRPLVVGACSKDKQARAGRVYGGFARGYRLHACMTGKGYFSAWQITAMNVSEKRVALALIDQTMPRGLVLADGNYDSGALYDCVARYGGQLLPTMRAGAGRGHRPQNANRLIAVQIWQSHAAWIRSERKSIDRFFGQHSSYGGGLAPLPAWIRTEARVTRWIGAKIILYHHRLNLRRSAA